MNVDKQIEYLSEQLKKETKDIAAWVYMGKSITYKQPILLKTGETLMITVEREN